MFASIYIHTHRYVTIITKEQITNLRGKDGTQEELEGWREC